VDPKQLIFGWFYGDLGENIFGTKRATNNNEPKSFFNYEMSPTYPQDLANFSPQTADIP